MEEAQERKRGKYKELLEACCGNGWKTSCMPVHAGHSPSKAYRMLGIMGASQRRAINNSMEAAEWALRWL